MRDVPRSGENVVDDVSMDICESEVSTGVVPRELFVIKSHQVQHGGMEVMNVDAVFDGAVAEFVGAAPGHSAFDTAARHPDGEAMMIVVATGGCASADRHFHGGCASEFATAEHEGFVEQSALSEICEEGGGGAIDFLTESTMFAGDITVRVPRLNVTMVALHDTYTAFDQSSCNQQLSTMDSLGVIQFVRCFRFAGQIERVGGFHLHPIGELEGLDACFQLSIFMA